MAKLRISGISDEAGQDLAAQIEAHKELGWDLIVRVTGFSAYFADLSDDFRNLVCERIVSLEN